MPVDNSGGHHNDARPFLFAGQSPVLPHGGHLSNTLGQIAIPNTGSTSTYADTASLSTTLPVGIHSIRIKALTDSFSVNQVKVN